MKRSFVFGIIVMLMLVACQKSQKKITVYATNKDYSYFILDGFNGSFEQRAQLDRLNPFLNADSLRIFENENQGKQYVIILSQKEYLQVGNLNITLNPLPANQVFVVDPPQLKPLGN